jgi:hypothetical protein
LLFDADRDHAEDRAIKVAALDLACPLWIVGDLHGDLLALEAALALIDGGRLRNRGTSARILFLGDLFDDEGFGLEVLLRVFELLIDTPELICILAGNHDEALSYDGVRFASSVEPSNFATFLNANLAHEWMERTGKLAVRLFARAARALLPRRDASPTGSFLWRTCIRSSSRTRIGTIPHACLISCGPGRTRLRARSFPIDFPAAVSLGMRISGAWSSRFLHRLNEMHATPWAIAV